MKILERISKQKTYFQDVFQLVLSELKNSLFFEEDDENYEKSEIFGFFMDLEQKKTYFEEMKILSAKISEFNEIKEQ